MPESLPLLLVAPVACLCSGKHERPLLGEASEVGQGGASARALEPPPLASSPLPLLSLLLSLSCSKLSFCPQPCAKARQSAHSVKRTLPFSSAVALSSCPVAVTASSAVLWSSCPGEKASSERRRGLLNAASPLPRSVSPLAPRLVGAPFLRSSFLLAPRCDVLQQLVLRPSPHSPYAYRPHLATRHAARSPSRHSRPHGALVLLPRSATARRPHELTQRR